MSPQINDPRAVGYRGTDAQSSGVPRQGCPGRRPARIPILQSGQLDPAEYARTTCFAAGYLTVKNSGWRNIRPVVRRETCTGCLKCYLYCPDGAVFKVENDPADAASVNKTDTTVAIDLDFCKGCGICARVCAAGSIEMVSESQEAARRADNDEGGVR